MNIRYLDYPLLPESLWPEVYKAIAGENIFRGGRDPNYMFKNYAATPALADWFNEYVRPLLQSVKSPLYVQTIERRIHAHKDWNRDLALNYIIDQGGPNVITTFRNDSKIITDSYNLIPHRWHELNTSAYHEVDNIETKRIALSINLK